MSLLLDWSFEGTVSLALGIAYVATPLVGHVVRAAEHLSATIPHAHLATDINFHSLP